MDREYICLDCGYANTFTPDSGFKVMFCRRCNARHEYHLHYVRRIEEETE